MTDHDDEDTTTVPDTTVTAPFPRVRRDTTRLDPHAMYDVPDPTRVTPAPPVSPIGTHTGGTRPAEVINRMLDERERAQDRRDGRTAAHAARTLREEAQRRAVAKLRHERHLEFVEKVRAYVTLAILVALLTLVVGAGVIGFGILDGWFAWAPTRTR